jgi:hypothetical protein
MTQHKVGTQEEWLGPVAVSREFRVICMSSSVWLSSY